MGFLSSGEDDASVRCLRIVSGQRQPSRVLYHPHNARFLRKAAAPVQERSGTGETRVDVLWALSPRRPPRRSLSVETVVQPIATRPNLIAYSIPESAIFRKDATKVHWSDPWPPLVRALEQGGTNERDQGHSYGIVLGRTQCRVAQWIAWRRWVVGYMSGGRSNERLGLAI